VVVTGVPGVPDWDFSGVLRRPGVAGAVMDLQTWDSSSHTWAGMVDAGQETLGVFLNALRGAGSGGDLQVFDQSLQMHAGLRPLFDELPPDFLHALFPRNLLLDTPPRLGFAAAWPSLFVSPRAARGSGTHVDFGRTHFWMAVLAGRKRWRVVHRADAAALYPAVALTGGEPVFGVEIADLVPQRGAARGARLGRLLERFPAAGAVTVMEASVGPGEVIVVPQGSPHQVSNEENTMALAGNVVDETNLKAATARLGWDALVMGEAFELNRELKRIKEKYRL